jgi:WD40 repeat protein
VATAIWVVERINDRNVVTNNCVKLWDGGSGKEQATLEAAFVSSAVFSPDGKTLATGSEDGNKKLWDVATNKEWVSFTGHTDKILSLTFSADGNRMASGSADKTIKVWDVAKAR